MGGFLIFLAIAVPVVLASPFFWGLVSMEFGAQRIGYIHQSPHGRVTQWATLGPKAPWPEWAVVPEGADLSIRSNFDAAPGLNATGMGDISAKTAARLTAEHYQAALRRAGWTVRVGRFDAASPDIPPRPIHWCIVEGRRGARVQRMSVDIDEAKTSGSLWWTVGPAKFPLGTKDTACW